MGILKCIPFLRLPCQHRIQVLNHRGILTSAWQALPLPDGPVELFIGILSAGNHFAERMAVRKLWMQSKLIKSANVVARLFVAPVCEVSAKYVRNCEDDTFVRVDAVLKEAKKVPVNKSLYVGNMNYCHKPLRDGKWAVTYEEWTEEAYLAYANGPGYMVSSDIAQFIVSDFEKHKAESKPHQTGGFMTAQWCCFSSGMIELPRCMLGVMQGRKIGLRDAQNTNRTLSDFHSDEFTQ